MRIRTVLLIRHGASAANREKQLTGRLDSPLSREGTRQVKKIARYLAKRYPEVNVIYTSPLSRALDTAKIITHAVSAPIYLEDDLIEMNFGLWEGLKKDLLKNSKEWEQYRKDPFHFTFPDGESPQAVKQRIVSFKERLLAKNDWHTVVVVSHYTPLVFYILTVLDLLDASKAPFRLDNASITSIHYGEDFSYIATLNCRP